MRYCKFTNSMTDSSKFTERLYSKATITGLKLSKNVLILTDPFKFLYVSFIEFKLLLGNKMEFKGMKNW